MKSPISSSSNATKGVISNCISALGESPAVRIWLVFDQTAVAQQVQRRWLSCGDIFSHGLQLDGLSMGARCNS